MKRHAKRFLALLLCLMTVIALLASPISAASASSGGGISISDVNDILNAISYQDYRKSEAYLGAERGEALDPIKATDYDKDEKNTTAELEVLDEYYGKNGVLKISDTGKVTWTFTVEKAGLYTIALEYCQIVGKTNSIERVFYLNGEVPFSEARSIILQKTWKYQDGAYKDSNRDSFVTDSNDNDIRPGVEAAPEWILFTLQDADGYYMEPFEFYLEAGENTITLEGTREPVVLSQILIEPAKDTLTYKEYLEKYGDVDSNRGSGNIKIQAENPKKVSAVTMYPVYDRTSPRTEGTNGIQSAKHTSYNTFGKEQWQSVGEWVEYDIYVEKSGYYTISFRYKQDLLSGMYTSRKVYIDGALPFKEAAECRFNYTNSWQMQSLGNADTTFEFYLTEGKHTLRFEAVLGEMGEQIQKVSQSLANINSCYLEILKLTGSKPDKDRTYNFSRVMPDVMKTLMLESINLREVYDYLVSQVGKGEQTTTIEQVQRTLYTMASDDDQVAGNLETLKAHIGSLGTWINSAKTQPLQVDYILVQSGDEELPKAESNFFVKLWYEVKLFFYSFFTDYNSMGGDNEIITENITIDVWVTSGRDQAQIIRNLIDNRFTPSSGISVNLKLISAGTLLPSVLAGVGPDVALFEASNTIIDYALRDAVLPLNEFIAADLAKGNDVLASFPEAAMVPLTLYDYSTETGKEEPTYYGLPDTLTFSMMFYRKDVLASLGLDIPKTWDDLLSMIPVLQYNNMEIGIQNDIYTFIYQNGYEAYADAGTRINFDNVGVLNAFTQLCRMYTDYSLPYQFDFANRFRTGEMPIGIAPYTTCNQLSVFASELSGLWGFVPLPGIEVKDDNGNVVYDEYGNPVINNCAIATVTGCVMLRGCTGENEQKAAWEFMKWYTGEEFQVAYSNEIVSIMGIAQRPATANTEAIIELPWTAEEASNILAQFGNLQAVRNYPGSYYLARYVNFAFLAAYNDGKDPADALLSYVNTINKEINRKRAEFDKISNEDYHKDQEKRTAAQSE